MKKEYICKLQWNRWPIIAKEFDGFVCVCVCVYILWKYNDPIGYF